MLCATTFLLCLLLKLLHRPLTNIRSQFIFKHTTLSLKIRLKSDHGQSSHEHGQMLPE